MQLNIMKAWNTLLGIERKDGVTDLGGIDSPAFRDWVYGLNFDLYPENLTFDVVAQEGFEKNLITYRCISLIANGVANLKYNLYNTQTGEQIKQHKILKLLKEPNPMQGQHTFLAHVMSDLLLDGNAFIEKVVADLRNMGQVSLPSKQAPGRLWTNRPDMVFINVGSGRLPISYVYTPGGIESGNSKTYPVDQNSGDCNLIHLSTYAPLRENLNGRGLSPVRSAWISVLTHNQGALWNLSLIRNGARPSQVITSDSPLTQEQVAQLKQQMAHNQAGAKNAAKTMVLGGGLKVTEASLNPVDLAYLEGKESVARDICTALGVPPPLMNLQDTTFNNYAQAKMALYEETILPYAHHLLGELNRWLVPLFGDNLCFEIDMNAIPALAPKRAEKWQQINQSSFLTVNEKRSELGFEPVGDEGDVILVPSNLLPLSEQIIVDELPSTSPSQSNPEDDPNSDEEDDEPTNSSNQD